MAAIFCIPTIGGLRGYKIWQPHSVSPSYSVSSQVGGVMGGDINNKHSWRGLSCHSLGQLVSVKQVSCLFLTNF